MNQGIPLNKTFNAPAKLVIKGADVGGKDYVVGNYADAGLGTLDIVQATMKSSNTAYVQLMQEVGPENVVALAHRMGITSELDPVLSLTLGVSDVSVIDMASAYSTLADGGEHRRSVHRLQGHRRRRATSSTSTRRRATRSSTTRWPRRSTTPSTRWWRAAPATGAKIAQPAAGKTGTTENYRDAWFAGYTCKLTTVVWMGYPDLDANGQTRNMTSVHGKSVTGGSYPATIWRKYMQKATEGLDSCPFPKPTLAPYTGSADTLPTGPTTSQSVTPSSTEPPSSTTTTRPPSTTTTTRPPTTTTTTAPVDHHDDEGVERVAHGGTFAVAVGRR